MPHPRLYHAPVREGGSQDISRKQPKHRGPVHQGPARHLKRKSLLFIWVEGGSDARFFEAVMKSLFEKKYDRVVIRAYASMKRVKFSALLGAIRAMGADYLVVADNDHAPCITAKKESVSRGVAGVQPQRIRVVVEEIEGWYAAGGFILDRWRNEAFQA